MYQSTVIFCMVPATVPINPPENPSAKLLGTTRSTCRSEEEMNFSEWSNRSAAQFVERQPGSHSLVPPRKYIVHLHNVLLQSNRAKCHSSSLHRATETPKVQAWTFRLPLLLALVLVSFDSKNPPPSRAARAAWLICLSTVMSVPHNVKRPYALEPIRAQVDTPEISRYDDEHVFDLHDLQ